MNIRTSTEDDRNFISEVISSSLLEDSINYIVNRYSAEELYGKDVLESWAADEGYISEDRAQDLEDKIDSLRDEISDLKMENETLQNELNELF